MQDLMATLARRLLLPVTHVWPRNCSDQPNKLTAELIPIQMLQVNKVVAGTRWGPVGNPC